jgi:hypothetical protein
VLESDQRMLPGLPGPVSHGRRALDALLDGGRRKLASWLQELLQAEDNLDGLSSISLDDVLLHTYSDESDSEYCHPRFHIWKVDKNEPEAAQRLAIFCDRVDVKLSVRHTKCSSCRKHLTQRAAP